MSFRFSVDPCDSQRNASSVAMDARHGIDCMGAKVGVEVVADLRGVEAVADGASEPRPMAVAAQFDVHPLHVCFTCVGVRPPLLVLAACTAPSIQTLSQEFNRPTRVTPWRDSMHCATHLGLAMLHKQLVLSHAWINVLHGAPSCVHNSFDAADICISAHLPKNATAAYHGSTPLLGAMFS